MEVEREGELRQRRSRKTGLEAGISLFHPNSSASFWPTQDG